MAAGINTYAYVRSNPLNSTDPLGLWQFSLFGGYGWSFLATLGHNSGQWNFGLYAGPGGGLDFKLSPEDAPVVQSGLYTNIDASGGADVGPISVDAGADMQTSLPNDASERKYGHMCFSASANFGYYSAGGKFDIGPNGVGTLSPEVNFGLGGGAHMCGVVIINFRQIKPHQMR